MGCPGAHAEVVSDQHQLPRGAEWSPRGTTWRCVRCGEESATGQLILGRGFMETPNGTTHPVTFHLQILPSEVRICGVVEEVGA